MSCCEYFTVIGKCLLLEYDIFPTILRAEYSYRAESRALSSCFQLKLPSTIERSVAFAEVGFSTSADSQNISTELLIYAGYAISKFIF
jgi:hypothetical protein